MATEMKTIIVEPDSELAAVVEQAAEAPILLEKNGQRFRLTRESEDRIANHDPERTREALRRSFGTLRGVDVEDLKRDLREQREQDSIGRPSE
ncbi:MAG: hypothetical protein ACRDJW_14935 [Thermomicrobiales bacterium]